MQRVAVCCSVLQCVAVRCGVSSMCPTSGIMRIALGIRMASHLKHVYIYTSVAVSCSVLRCVAVCCSVLHASHECDDEDSARHQNTQPSEKRIYIYIWALCSSVLQCVACVSHEWDDEDSARHQNAQPSETRIYIYMCCSVLQCVAMYCSVLQSVAVLFLCVAACCSGLHASHNWDDQDSIQHQNTQPSETCICMHMYCSVLLSVAVCCSVLQCVAVCSSVLQCVAFIPQVG